MKVVILAGGFGTRLSEETLLRPKPMVDIGGMPILWHIMKIYSSFGLNDFVICCGYKGYLIKEFFANYFLHLSDVTIDLANNEMKIHQNQSEPWKVTLIDTGISTMTGGRLRRVKEHLEGQDFCFTYGDGVGNIDIQSLIDSHKKNKTLATLTAVRSPGRFGIISLKDNFVENFEEKPMDNNSWINGGFFVLSPGIFDYIESDETVWEAEPLKNLALNNQLAAFKHYDFWQPMDTLRDQMHLEDLWKNNKAPWKTWI